VNLDEAFRALEEMAKGMAALYRHWSESFEEDGEAALIFSRMATEEVSHANLANYQRRLLRKSTQPLPGDIDLVFEEILLLTEISERALEGPAHSLEEAVCLACWMEASAAEKALRNTIHESNPELRRLLAHLGGDDQRHVERLKTFAGKRQISLHTPDGL
jgi:rubrerythrin